MEVELVAHTPDPAWVIEQAASVCYDSTPTRECMMTRAKIEYEECNDIDVMNSKGIMSVPCLEVDGNIMDFKSAFQWVKGIEA